jgi:hypothetical protein
MVMIHQEVNDPVLGYKPNLKRKLSMKVGKWQSGWLMVTILLGLGYGLACRWLWPHEQADALIPIAEPKRWEEEPLAGAVCKHWRLDGPPIKPGPLLQEMSGIVSSRIYKDILYHVADSGNDPLILVTDLQGRLLQQIRYAESSTDPEALSQGPCPWGGHCLFVADTGDNFHIRRKKRIHAIDESTLFTKAMHSAEMEFRFPNQDRLDVEALAVHPQTGDMFMFSKEAKRSMVFRLPAASWRKNDGQQLAEAVGFLLYDRVTDAAWSADGKRLLLLNWQGVFERTGQADIEHSEREGWLPYERKIRLPQLAQQEAVTFLPDQRSIIYSSEKKLFQSGRWGIASARCISGEG